MASVLQQMGSSMRTWLKPAAWAKPWKRLPSATVDALVLSARPAAKPGARILGEAQRVRLNRGVEPLTRFDAQSARTRAARALYQDGSFFERAQAELQRWIFGGKDQLPLREAFENFGRGINQTATDDTFRTLLKTRQARWQRLARRHGLDAPTHFQLHRGVNSNRAAEEVARVWEQSGKRGLSLKHHSVNSWSLDKQVAERFANGSEAAVVYRANIPMKRTLADKWVDGGAFLQWAPDQDEVIVMGKQLAVPAREIRVTFQGKTYGYEDRQAFLKAWRAVHPQAS